MRKIFITILVTVLFSGLGFAQARMTDAESDGLKGKVQEVSHERSGMERKDDKWKATPRTVLRVTTYDQKGRKLVSGSYASQKMFSRTVYLEVDGVRAMKSEAIRDNSNDGVPPRIMIGTPPNGPQKPDPRYEIKYLDTYDEKGNRTEVVVVKNDGRVHVLTAYRFDEKGNQIEVAFWKDLEEAKRISQSVISPRRNLDKLLRRTVEVEGRKLVMVRDALYVAKFDTDGTETDNFLFDDAGKVKAHTRYAEYEFDANRNWTKRVSFAVEMKAGKEELTPEAIEYQVIKYHP